MPDQFRDVGEKLDSSPERGITVTPSDSADLPNGFVSKCLNVSVTGPVRVTLKSGNVVTYFIAAGIQFECRAKRVHSTGTNAGTIVAG